LSTAIWVEVPVFPKALALDGQFHSADRGVLIGTKIKHQRLNSKMTMQSSNFNDFTFCTVILLFTCLPAGRHFNL